MVQFNKKSKITAEKTKLDENKMLYVSHFINTKPTQEIPRPNIWLSYAYLSLWNALKKS